MKLRSVRINNFMGIGEAHLSLADKGLVLVQGENLDNPSAVSNGAGKSSVADAIFWCDFGSTARDKLSADAVVNRTAGKDCWVENEYEEADGGVYTIKRWRKLSGAPKKNGVSITYTDPAGVTVDLTKGTDALTQPEIDKALGRNEEVSLAAVYAGQEKLPNLPAMSDGDLKRLIEESSGVTTLIRAYDIARQKFKDAENDLSRWRLDHARLERSVLDIDARHKDLVARRDSFEQTRSGQVANLASDLQASVARAKKHKQDRDDVNAENVQRAIDELDTKIASVHAENEEQARLQAIERDLGARLTTMQANFRRARQDALDDKAELDGVNARIGTPCTTCGKPYAEHDLDAATTLAKGKLQKSAEKAREMRSDVEELQRQHEVAKTALTDFIASKTDISATVAERSRLANLLAARNKAEQALAAEMSIAQRIKQDLDAKKAEKNPYIELADTAEEELKGEHEEHRESEQKGKALEQRVMVLRDVVKVYGPAGVRAHILDTVTPMLNDRTAEYLGILSDGSINAIWSTLVPDGKGELKEKFSITVSTEDDAGEHAGLSGGEKRKVRLATALALQDLVASRATKPLALWIGDEIDDALDTAGLERLMTVLENKARERGTVVVISHNALQDWIRETAMVTRKDGRSTVSGALEHT